MSTSFFKDTIYFCPFLKRHGEVVEGGRGYGNEHRLSGSPRQEKAIEADSKTVAEWGGEVPGLVFSHNLAIFPSQGNSVP